MGLSAAFVLWSGDIGGAERQTAALARALMAEGVRVRVVILGEREPFASLLGADLDLEALGLARGRDALTHAGALRAAVLGFDVCVLPSNGFLPRILAGRVPVLVAMEHGDALNARALMGPWRRAAYRLARFRGARFLDCEIAVSAAARDALLALPHAPRVEVIHNGLEAAHLKVAAESARDHRGYVIGALGRLFPGKGFEAAIEAVGELARSGEDVRLVIGGDGPLREQLVRRAQELGVSERVELVGWVSDVAEFWAQCDVGAFVTDSLTESFGLASLEALACGVPAIVSSSATQRELLGTAPDVWAVAPGDAHALAAALAMALEHEDSLECRLARWTWVADTFGIEKCATRYYELLDGLVASKVRDN